MRRNSGTRVRFALAVVAGAVLISLVAMPASAFAAKAATRIVTTATKVVHSDTQGTTGWPVTITASLQRKSGSRWVAASGTVKLYLWQSVDEGHYEYLGSRKGSSVSFPITERGKYKLVYSGTSTRKPSTAYSRVYESVGIVVGTPVIEVGPPDANMVRVVHVRCAVDWNTTAHPNGFNVDVHSYVRGRRNDWFELDRWLSQPGTVEFWYAVIGDDVGDLSEIPYVEVTADVQVDDGALIGLLEPAYATVTITN